MKKTSLLLLLIICSLPVFSWGFYGHRMINYYAVFLLPPEMMLLYKPNIDFLTEHAVDPDKRRYTVPEEGPRHYIDLDKYGQYPYDSLPRNWNEAVKKYTADSLQKHGIVPWWVQTMLFRLTQAFKDKDHVKILKLSAEIGHYISDAHVPLHASSNHNGQYTNQRGIHGFWESRVPELLAEKHWDFFIGKAEMISNPSGFIWARVLESAAAADTVLRFEKELSRQFPPDQKYAFEDRNGTVIRQYSSAYTVRYNELLKGMVERRMRQSIYAVASFWYTAWVNAGQPDLRALSNREFTSADQEAFEQLNRDWKNNAIKGREHDH
ncbi:MAG TPA: zinc dependent phospholipase C family protein [Chitinophagaceae bacterium]|nr:zinc dependent phospholipase C family protein [Chitinophagaceae bacterium]HPN58750.1 zinc dependent phospholipase C family protein [Chitinophagaceae bacterium]